MNSRTSSQLKSDQNAEREKLCHVFGGGTGEDGAYIIVLLSHQPLSKKAETETAGFSGGAATTPKEAKHQPSAGRPETTERENVVVPRRRTIAGIK